MRYVLMNLYEDFHTRKNKIYNCAFVRIFIEQTFDLKTKLHKILNQTRKL